MMGILVCSHAALLWAITAAPFLQWSPTYVVDCSCTQVFPGGAKTPLGAVTLVLREGNGAGVPPSQPVLDGGWKPVPTLNVSLAAVSANGDKYQFKATIANSIQRLDFDGNLQQNTTALECSFAEAGRDLVALSLDGHEGIFEFEFRLRGARGGWDRMASRMAADFLTSLKLGPQPMTIP